MTNELEKQFFDTFGIEPNCKFVKYCDDCTKCGCYHHPRITPDILLGLICITTDEEPNIEWLKQCVLENLIHRFEKNLFCDKEQAVKQVRTLFEEG